MTAAALPFEDFFRTVAARYGVNLTIFYDRFDAELFATGIYHTLLLSVVSILLSVAIGGAGAYLLFMRNRGAARMVGGYVQVFRNTPPLIQLYFFYFALGPTLSKALAADGPLIGNVAWAIVSLTLYAGAFNVEIFRAGIEAVPRTTLEAAEALGMSRRQQFTHLAMPLAWRISFPALNNNLVNLIKTTTNAYAIAVPELLYAASQIWSEHLNTLEMMMVLLAFYIVVIGVFILLMTRWERSMRVPGWGHA
jgi:polar amino acid transport system permease protein